MIYFFLYSFALILILSRGNRRNRRLELVRAINNSHVRRIKWTLNNHTAHIMLTQKSYAKMSRNTGPGLSQHNAIIIKFFWLDGKLCNTDTFCIDNLTWNDTHISPL